MKRDDISPFSRLNLQYGGNMHYEAFKGSAIRGSICLLTFGGAVIEGTEGSQPAKYVAGIAGVLLVREIRKMGREGQEDWGNLPIDTASPTDVPQETKPEAF